MGDQVLVANAVEFLRGHARRDSRTDGLDGTGGDASGLADLCDRLGSLDVRGGHAFGTVVEHILGALDVLGHGAHRRDASGLQRAQRRAACKW